MMGEITLARRQFASLFDGEYNFKMHFWVASSVVERLVHIEEVIGSSPMPPTFLKIDRLI